MDKHIKMLGSINSKEDFLEFMDHFIPTVHSSPVSDYLTALTAWAEDMEGYYKNAGKQVPAEINWDIIAAMLYAGSIYE